MRAGAIGEAAWPLPDVPNFTVPEMKTGDDDGT